jgi:hypothetical protein
MTPRRRRHPDPDPAPVFDQDAEAEAGENLDSHLLPDPARLRRLLPRERAELLEAVKDWTGPAVERWRDLARSMQ